ncbi:PadR family transcriptional regulator [Bacillus mycoides]|nr:PadR family transcriptional regulator [Bacillus mycoides]
MCRNVDIIVYISGEPVDIFKKSLIYFWKYQTGYAQRE